MSADKCDRCGAASFGSVKVLVLERLVQDRPTCLQCAALVDNGLRRFWEGAPEPTPSPAPPTLPERRKYTMSAAAKAQRSGAGKGNGIERNDRTKSNEIETKSNEMGNEISFMGGRGAASSFKTTKESASLEAEEAARARNEIRTKSPNEIGTKSNEIERNGGAKALRILPPPPRPSIEGLPPPSELRRPNSAAERKQVAELLGDMQIARQLANLYPLPLQERERPYFDDFALRALAGGDAETVVQGFGEWLQEEWTQEHRGPWLTWFRQWQGKLRARPAPPAVAAACVRCGGPAACDHGSAPYCYPCVAVAMGLKEATS